MEDERALNPRALSLTREQTLVLKQTAGCLFGANPRLLWKWRSPGAVDLDRDGPLQKRDRQHQAMLPSDFQQDSFEP